MRSITHHLVFVGSLALAACGGATPAPSEPAPAAAEPAPEPEAKVAEPAEPDAPAPEPAKAEPEAVVKRSPQDIITEENVLFSFSFRDSDVYAVAEKKCAEKSGDNPQKNAACMQKEGDALTDSMFLKQGPDGKWRYTVLRRSGAKATVLHKVEVEFGAETETTITLNPKGRDEGSKPFAGSKPIVLEVRDGNVIVNDPKHGKMVYLPKAGLIQ